MFLNLNKFFFIFISLFFSNSLFSIESALADCLREQTVASFQALERWCLENSFGSMTIYPNVPESTTSSGNPDYHINFTEVLELLSEDKPISVEKQLATALYSIVYFFTFYPQTSVYRQRVVLEGNIRDALRMVQGLYGSRYLMTDLLRLVIRIATYLESMGKDKKMLRPGHPICLYKKTFLSKRLQFHDEVGFRNDNIYSNIGVFISVCGELISPPACVVS